MLVPLLLLLLDRFFSQHECIQLPCQEELHPNRTDVACNVSLGTSGAHSVCSVCCCYCESVSDAQIRLLVIYACTVIALLRIAWYSLSVIMLAASIAVARRCRSTQHSSSAHAGCHAERQHQLRQAAAAENK